MARTRASSAGGPTGARRLRRRVTRARGAAPVVPVDARALRAKRRADARHKSAIAPEAAGAAAPLTVLPDDICFPDLEKASRTGPASPLPASTVTSGPVPPSPESATPPMQDEAPDLATLARAFFGPLNGVDLDLFGRRGERTVAEARAW